MRQSDLGYGKPISIPPSSYHHSRHSEMSAANQLPPQLYNQPNHQMQNLNFSKLEDHNVHYHTDKLYDPLRNTLLHPEAARYYEK